MKTLKNIGTYIALKLTPDSRRQFSRLWSTNLRDAMDHHSLHCTMMISHNNLPRRVLGVALAPSQKFTGEITEITQLGNYTVAMLESEQLQRRHQFWRKLGLTHIFPEYLPHVSLLRCDYTPELKEQLQGLVGLNVTLHREYAEDLKQD